MAWAAALLIAVAGVAWTSGGPPMLDPDTWMRLAFVQHAVSGAGLENYLFPRDGAPAGMQIMWTLPFDGAVAAVAAPLAPFLGWRAALAETAALHGPLWLVAVALSAGALARSTGLRGLAPWAAALAATAPAAAAYAQSGRVSHHDMTLALATMAVASALAFLRRPDGRRACWSGAWMAAACWASMETLPVVLAASGIVVIAAATRRRANVAAWAMAAPALALAALLADPPPEGLLVLSVDRFSALHVAAIASAGLAALAARLAASGVSSTRGKLTRGLLAAVAVGVAAGACLALVASFPGDLSDPFVHAYLWGQDMENRPTASVGAWGLAAWPAPEALAFLSWGAWRRRRRPQALAWTLAAALIAAEIALGLASVRLNSYAAVTGAVVMAAAARGCLRRALRADDHTLTAVVAAGLGFAAVAMLVLPRPSMGRTPDACPMDAAVGAAVDRVLPEGSIVAAEMWMSPGLLWNSHVRTIAGPYHRNVRGIADLARIFISTDPAVPRRLLDARRTSAVLACADASHTDTSVFLPGSLQAEIVAGRAPGWLREVPMPAAARHTRLFLVEPQR